MRLREWVGPRECPHQEDLQEGHQGHQVLPAAHHLECQEVCTICKYEILLLINYY